jgi:hypothetical protein
MINIDNFVKSKQIKFIYKIINSEMDSWNAIGKHWLQKYVLNMCLSKMSFLDSVEHDPKKVFHACIAS